MGSDVVVEPILMAVPSEGVRCACTNMFIAVMPSAPGRLLITTGGLPGRYLVRNGAMTRADASVPPPAAKPTMKLTVLPSNETGCACADDPVAISAAANTKLHTAPASPN